MVEPVSVVLESVAALENPDRLSFTFALTNNTRVHVGVSKLDLNILCRALKVEGPEGPLWLFEIKPNRGPPGCIFAPPDSIDKAVVGPRKRIYLTIEERGRLSEGARSVINEDKRPMLVGEYYVDTIVGVAPVSKRLVVRGPVDFGAEN